MPTLIVPTDFSPNAEKALGQAILLAQQTGSELALLYTVELEHAESAYFKMHIMDEARNAASRLDTLMRSLMEAAGISEGIGWKAHVQYTDKLEDGILKLFEEVDGKLVVMGTKGARNWADKLFGSHTAKLIGKATVPVLCIPPNWNPVPLKKLAVCLEPEQVAQYEEEARSWGQWMGCEVEWLHFTPVPSVEGAAPNSSFPYEAVLSPTETPLYEDIVEHSRRLEATAMAMFVRPRSFFEKLFDPSITKKTAGLIEAPLLALPG